MVDRVSGFPKVTRITTNLALLGEDAAAMDLEASLTRPERIRAWNLNSVCSMKTTTNYATNFSSPVLLTLMDTGDAADSGNTTPTVPTIPSPEVLTPLATSHTVDSASTGAASTAASVHQG